MITLGIALLLAAGFLGARVCRVLHLPAVTGYILAGLLLGPTGVGVITSDSVGEHLDHFTEIALMLIAFGIGEHIELHSLKKHARSLFWIGVCETSCALVMVAAVVYGAVRLGGFQVEGWGRFDYVALALLLGAVGVATAPAATLLVARELRAKGPLTTTLMGIVAIDDGLAIMLFGLVVSITHQLLGHTGDPLIVALLASVGEIMLSLLLGGLAGVVLIVLVNRLKESGEIMTAGLATLLLCAEVALFFHLSPLLAGMAAGFVLVNKAERDVRIFRELNKFEPPIYVLFFTLAGTHLDIDSLRAAGIIGVLYFFARILGKITGVALGARIAGSLPAVRKYLGFALLPQAGVAIGLIFLLSSDPAFGSYTSIITPVVLAGVFLSELIGPVSARYALTRAGEAYAEKVLRQDQSENGRLAVTRQGEGVAQFQPVPWRWRKLMPPRHPQGFVIFHGDDDATARGLARLATIVANHHQALPMAVQVVPQEQHLPPSLFQVEHNEVHIMGYTLATELIPEDDLAVGLVTAAEYYSTHAVFLAYPLAGDEARFHGLLRGLTKRVFCPVAVVRFLAEIHTERILVPVSDLEQLEAMFDILCGLASIGEHRLRLLYMSSPTDGAPELEEKRDEINQWLGKHEALPALECAVVPTESRLQLIVEEANDADLLVMAAEESGVLQRFLFGSLIDAVACRIRKNLIVVYHANGSKFRKKNEEG